MSKKIKKFNPATTVKYLAIACKYALPMCEKVFNNQTVPLAERLAAGKAIDVINRAIIIA